MSGKTISTSETRLEAFQIQSSAYGVTIPMVWGVTRITGNLIDYNGFKAIPHTETQGGKGGGTKTQSTTYTYSASVMMGLCHGQVTGLPRIWRGKKLFSGGVTPGQVLTTSETYIPPVSGTMQFTVSQSAAYTASVSVVDGVDIDNQSLLSQGTDYTVANGVYTIVNEFFRGRHLTITYQYTTGAVSQTALEQLGLSFKTGAIGQETWSYLTTSFPAKAIGYSGLAYVCGQDYDLGTGAQVENHTFEIVAPMAYHLGSSVPDVDTSLVLRDALTNSRAGAGFPGMQLASWSAWSDFCVASGLLVSPALEEQIRAADMVAMAAELTNTGPVWSNGRLAMVPYADSAVTGNGRTFTPNTTPVYDLDDECWLKAPVVEVKSPADRFNHVRVEFLNRANLYNAEIAEAKDQADIDANGLRSMPIKQAHWICDGAVARQVAQTLLQRSLYVTATYTAPFPWHFALLECVDLNTLTDAGLGLDKLPGRITVIEESEDGELTITHEDYPAGTASAAIYPSQVGDGYQHDYNVAPGTVETPVIFELPGDLAAASGLELGVAVRGTDANWGGCRVWVSMDGTNYRQVGAVYGGSRYGALTGPVASGVMPVLLNGGQLISGTSGDAAALNTLCYVGGSAPEYFAYETATLTGANAYSIGGLVRGAYHSNSASAHATGDPFVRVDDAIARSGAIDRGYIGKTVYVKCTSFNIYGAGEESLATAAAYSHTISGVMFGRGKLFRAIAAGAAETDGYQAKCGLFDGETGALISSVGRGYIVNVIDPVTGVVSFPPGGANVFDTYGTPSKADDMAAALNAIPVGQAVCVRSYDEPHDNRTNANLVAAMKRCGASNAVFGSPQFKFRSAYILVGIVGCGEGQGREAYQGSVDSDPHAWVDMSFQVKNGNLIVTGLGGTPRSLADYSYTGDLAATKNQVFIAGSDPGGANGDLWFNTGTHEWNAKSAGVWTVVSDVTATKIAAGITSQGVLATKDSVGTSLLELGAATETYTRTNTSVSITNAAHSPNGEGFNTTICTFGPYTPSVNCTIKLGVSGSGSYSTGTTGLGYAEIIGTIFISGAFDGMPCMAFYAKPGTSVSGVSFSLTGRRAFDLTAGTSYTFKFAANKHDVGDTASVTYAELDIEVIKR